MATTFDPTNQLIVLDTAIACDAEVLYSEWKLWVQQSDNSKYLPAFRTVGGDPLGGDLTVAKYFFLINNWRIKPLEQDQNLTVHGNITVDTNSPGTRGDSPFMPTTGHYNVVIEYITPVQAQGVSTSGSGGLTESQMRAILADVVINANITKVNGDDVGGAGTEADPWGPV